MTEEYDILIDVANVGDGSNVDVNINWTLQHLNLEGRVAAQSSILKSIFTDGLEMAEIGEARFKDMCSASAKAPAGFIKVEIWRGRVFNELYIMSHNDDYNDEAVKTAVTAFRRPMNTFFLGATKARHNDNLFNREHRLTQIIYLLLFECMKQCMRMLLETQMDETEKWKPVVTNEYK